MNIRITIKLTKVLLLTGLFLLLITHSPTNLIQAAINRPNVVWDQPQLIYETSGDISKPSLAADFWGKVHMVFSQSVHSFGEGKGEYVIIYTRLEDNVWTVPVDIIIDPRYNNATFSNLAVMPSGIGLITFHGYPGQTYLAGTINISNQFEAVHLWKKSVILSNSEVTFSSSLATQDGQLHLVYGNIGYPNNLYYITTSDGVNWTTPIQVSNNLPLDEAIVSAEIIKGLDGKLHVFWTTTDYPSGYPPLGTFYSYSSDSGKSWSDEVQIAGGNMAMAGATIYKDTLHVLLIGRATFKGRFDVWSADGGVTWTPPVVIDPNGDGLSGGDIVTDNNGGVHAVFGSSTNHEVVYAHWNGESWSQIVNIADDVPPTLEDIDLEIINGNHLVVTFVESHVRLWAVGADIEGIEPMATLSLPVTPSLETESVSSIAGPEPLSTAAVLPVKSQSATLISARSIGFPWISILFPIALILIVAIYHLRKSR